MVFCGAECEVECEMEYGKCVSFTDSLLTPFGTVFQFDFRVTSFQLIFGNRCYQCYRFDLTSTAVLEK